MTFNFKNLDEKTRQLMLEEFDFDQKEGTLAVSPRLIDGKEEEYFRLFTQCIKSGQNEDYLANTIQQARILKSQETANRNGKIVNVKVRHDAHEFLAQSDFNRFYMRALCRIAIEENKTLKIYRAKSSDEHRTTSDNIEGNFIEPNVQLNFLRLNPKDYWARKEQDSDITEYKVARPGSGLSLMLV